MYIRFLFLVFFVSTQYLYAQKPISTAKPWAYWWWLGSAVDEKNVTANLEDFAKAGFGGLHIIPIYGVKGEEAKFIPYLSPRWVEILDYTVKEAQRLGLGIDMTLGTGWPLGGAHVTEKEAAKSFKITHITSKPQSSYTEYSEAQSSYSPTSNAYKLTISPTRQKVKRAAPGAEGFVIDHFSKEALTRYIQPFDSIFSQKNIGIRAFYNDSYEVYGANWTPQFFEKFKILRGYDLAQHLDVLAKDTAITEREKRIWADYHETLSDILLNDFTKNLNDFGHKHQKILRNEAHGSPANILDLYAASDVPESEFFGSKPYNIPFYRQDPDYEVNRFGTPDAVILKLASSPAHITGKKLVSSETATWLGNHFKVSLKQIKPIIDESFIGGINHIFYHGVPYSPKDAPFPGWLFYASTNFNQQSHFWEHLPQLNSYIERCQTLLQNSAPDNDILLYFPLVDTWHSAGKKAKTHALDVHSLLRDGFLNPAFKDIVFELHQKGYAFDYVSDRQLQNLQSYNTYKTVLIPPVTYMPIETLKALEVLKNKGLKIVFLNKLPEKVNGFFEFEKRQIEFEKTINNLTSNTPSVFDNISQVINNQIVRRETIRDKGLEFIRKRTDKSTLYFISNFDTLFEKGIINLESMGEAARLFYPLNNQEIFVGVKKINNNSIELPLELASGESVFIEIYDKTSSNQTIKNSKLITQNPKLEKILRGSWQVDFISGQPVLPKNYSTTSLSSWTNNSDSMAQYFSGKARYTLSFNLKRKERCKKSGWLDLGDVRESADVKLNGVSLGTAWSLPMRVYIPQKVLKKKNILEIEVTNLSANRMRYLDKKGVNWKRFYDINMVDIQYNPFDAAKWKPIESGLLGPISLKLY